MRIHNGQKPPATRLNVPAKTGPNLYAYLQTHSIKVTGINPDSLRLVQFDREALKSKIEAAEAKSMVFQIPLNASQLKEIFLTPGLPDIVPEKGRLRVNLRIAALGTLTDKELLSSFKTLEENECYETIAEIDEHLGRMSSPAGLFLMKLYQRVGNIEAGLAVFDRVGAKDNKLKLANRELKRTAQEAEEKKKQTVIEKFRQLTAGLIEAADFHALMPAGYAEILEEHILRNISQENYKTVRRCAEQDPWFNRLLNKVVEHIYRKVRDGEVKNYSDDDLVLGLILKEDKFLPPQDWMPEYAKKAYFRKHPYLPAKKLYDSIYLNDCIKAEEAVQNRDFLAAVKLYRKASSVYPADKNMAKSYQAFLLVWAQDLYGKGKAKKAIAVLKAAVKIDPKNKNTLALLAYYYSDQGKYDEALAEATKFIALQPNDPKMLNLLGFAYHQRYCLTGDDLAAEAAIEYLERSYKIMPNSPQVLFNLSLAYIAVGNKAKAVEFMKKRLAMGGNINILRIYLELILINLKDDFSDSELADVIKSIKAEVPLDKDATKYMNIITALFEAGYEQAAEAFALKIEDTALKGAAAYARAINYFKKGDYDKALALLKPVLEGEDQALIYNDYLSENISIKIDAANLYLALIAKSDPDRAKLEGERMLESIPSEILYSTMGNVYEDSSPLKALEMYKRAAELNPYFILSTLNQLSVYRKQGRISDYQAAVAALREAISGAIERGKTDQFKYKTIYQEIFIEFDKTGLPELREIMNMLLDKFPKEFNESADKYLNNQGEISGKQGR